jgi:protein phosphatase
VGESNGSVAIYQGVPEDVWIFPLSSVYEETDIPLEQLLPFQQEKVSKSFPVDSLEEAREFIDRLVVAGP